MAPLKPISKSKRQKVVDLYETIFSTLGLDPEKTFSRIFDALSIQCSGLFEPLEVSTIKSTTSQAISLTFPLYSLCEHHFMPFIGTIHLKYTPSKDLLGFGSFERIIAHFTKRPQLQEKLTQQLFDYLLNLLNPQKLSLTIKAKHYCLLTQQVQDPSPIKTHLES